MGDKEENTIYEVNMNIENSERRICVDVAEDEDLKLSYAILDQNVEQVKTNEFVNEAELQQAILLTNKNQDVENIEIGNTVPGGMWVNALMNIFDCNKSTKISRVDVNRAECQKKNIDDKCVESMFGDGDRKSKNKEGVSTVMSPYVHNLELSLQREDFADEINAINRQRTLKHEKIEHYILDEQKKDNRNGDVRGMLLLPPDKTSTPFTNKIKQIGDVYGNDATLCDKLGRDSYIADEFVQNFGIHVLCDLPIVSEKTDKEENNGKYGYINFGFEPDEPNLQEFSLPKVHNVESDISAKFQAELENIHEQMDENIKNKENHVYINFAFESDEPMLNECIEPKTQMKYPVVHKMQDQITGEGENHEYVNLAFEPDDPYMCEIISAEIFHDEKTNISNDVSFEEPTIIIEETEKKEKAHDYGYKNCAFKPDEFIVSECSAAEKTSKEVCFLFKVSHTQQNINNEMDGSRTCLCVNGIFYPKENGSDLTSTLQPNGNIDVQAFIEICEYSEPSEKSSAMKETSENKYHISTFRESCIKASTSQQVIAAMKSETNTSRREQTTNASELVCTDKGYESENGYFNDVLNVGELNNSESKETGYRKARYIKEVCPNPISVNTNGEYMNNSDPIHQVNFEYGINKISSATTKESKESSSELTGYLKNGTEHNSGTHLAEQTSGVLDECKHFIPQCNNKSYLTVQKSTASSSTHWKTGHKGPAKTSEYINSSQLLPISNSKGRYSTTIQTIQASISSQTDILLSVPPQDSNLELDSDFQADIRSAIKHMQDNNKGPTSTSSRKVAVSSTASECSLQVAANISTAALSRGAVVRNQSYPIPEGTAGNSLNGENVNTSAMPVGAADAFASAQAYVLEFDREGLRRLQHAHENQLDSASFEALVIVSALPLPKSSLTSSYMSLYPIECDGSQIGVIQSDVIGDSKASAAYAEQAVSSIAPHSAQRLDVTMEIPEETKEMGDADEASAFSCCQLGACAEHLIQPEGRHRMMKTCKETVWRLLSKDNSCNGRPKDNGIVAVMLVSIFAVLVGFIDGWPANAFPFLIQQYKNIKAMNGTNVTNHSPKARTAMIGYLSERQAAWASSLVAVGAVVVSPVAGMLADTAGRKKMLQFITVPSFVSWILIAFYSNEVIMMYTARFLAGVVMGIVFVTLPLYNSEVIQEFTGIIEILMEFTGIFVVFFLGAMSSYTAVALIGCGISAVCGVLIIFAPESPPNLVFRGKFAEARSALKWLLGWRDEATPKPNPIAACVLLLPKGRPRATSGHVKWTFRRILRALSKPICSRRIIQLFSLVAIRQLSGMQTVVFHVVEIFSDAQTSVAPSIQAIIVGLVQLIGSYSSIRLLGVVNHNKLLIISSIGTAICHCGVSLYFLFYDRLHHYMGYSWLPLLFISLLLIFHSFGMGPLPLFFIGEWTAPQDRSWGSSCAGLINWICMFCVERLFPLMISYLGDALTFAIFALFSLSYAAPYLLDALRNSQHSESNPDSHKRDEINSSHNSEDSYPDDNSGISLRIERITIERDLITEILNRVNMC